MHDAESRDFQVLSMMTNLEKYDEARKAAQAVSAKQHLPRFTHTHRHISISAYFETMYV
jgi:hypothetical protein